MDRRLTLRDTPWASERWGTAFFDREGIPTTDRTLVENGELRSFLLDSYAATATGMQSTGNAVGGPNSVPAVGPHSLTLAAGDLPLAELYKQACSQQPEFLVVHRFSGQVDPVTGDFSGVAKAESGGKNGERVCFTTETLVSGNLFSCLGTGLAGVSTPTQVVDCGPEAPWLLCDGVSVTSGKA